MRPHLVTPNIFSIPAHLFNFCHILLECCFRCRKRKSDGTWTSPCRRQEPLWRCRISTLWNTKKKCWKEKHKLRSRMLGTNLGAMYCYLELKEWHMHMHVVLEFWDRTQHIWVSGDWRGCVSLVTVQWRRRNPKGTDTNSRCWRIIVVNRCKFRRTVALSTKP